VVQSEGDGERSVKFRQLGGTQVSAMAGERSDGDSKYVVAIGSAVTSEAFVLPESYLGHVMVKGARHQNAHQSREQRDCSVSCDDYDWAVANQGKCGVPDVAALNQSSSLARHAVAEN